MAKPSGLIHVGWQPLQGALLVQAQLRGAALRWAWVWRADVRSAANAEKALIVQPHPDKSFGCRSWDGLRLKCTVSETNFDQLLYEAVYIDCLAAFGREPSTDR